MHLLDYLKPIQSRTISNPPKKISCDFLSGYIELTIFCKHKTPSSLGI